MPLRRATAAQLMAESSVPMATSRRETRASARATSSILPPAADLPDSDSSTPSLRRWRSWPRAGKARPVAGITPTRKLKRRRKLVLYLSDTAQAALAAGDAGALTPIGRPAGEQADKAR